MALIDGTQLVVDAETNLFNVSVEKTYACWINTAPMQSGDTFAIKAYVLDASGGAEGRFLNQSLVGVQADPMFYIPWLPNYKFRVSMERTAGVNRTFNWIRIEEG